MRPSASILAAACVASLVWSAAARADDVEARVREGVELRREQRDDAALAKFNEAYALAPTPRIRAQIALAHQALGHFVQAERDLVAALAASNDEWIARNRGSLERSLERVRARLAWIEIETTPASAEVWVNGERESSASPIRVIAGTVLVEARASGYASIRRALEVAGGTRLRESMSLTATVDASSASGAAVQSAPTPSTGARAIPSPSDARNRRTWMFVTGGAALALTAGGVVSLLLRENAASVYNDDSRCLYGNLSRDQRCGDYRADVVRDQWIAVAAFSVGGVAAGAAIWLYASEPSRPAAASSIRCVPSFTTLGLGCAGTF